MKANRVFGILSIFMAGYALCAALPSLLGAIVGRIFAIQEAAAIGIIGGADGPTAIFTSSKLAPHIMNLLFNRLPLLLFALCLGLYLFFRHKEKQSEKPED